MSRIVYGVDVSKDWIDVALTDRRVVRVAMEKEALAALARDAKAAGAEVLFEATGGYDLPLRRALGAADVAFRRVNPARARHFALSQGSGAKTDAVDARMLRRMGMALSGDPDQLLSKTAQELKDLHSRRRQLTQDRKRERTRRHQVEAVEVLASVTSVLAMLDTEIARFDALIAALIAADPALAEKAAHLRSMPGVGPVTVAALLAECPELGQVSDKEIAALAGLAPMANSSGKRDGPRQIRGGRKTLRDVLFMAGLTACRCNPTLRAFHDRLKAKGKAPKQAIIAVTRKLLIILNAMIRTQKPYEAKS